MAVIDTGSLTLVGTVTTLGEYDNADLGTWNDQPLSPTNQPTVEQDQLSATWNFYVDPAATNTLYIVVSNVADTNYGYIYGTGFTLIALTGFQFALGVPSSSYATFSNQFAVPGEALLGPVSGSSALLDTTPGWNLLTASGPTDDAVYQIGTTNVSDAFTHFSTVWGDTRIFGGGAFQLTFDPSVDLLNVNFDTLNVTATNGEGAYTEVMTTQYWITGTSGDWSTGPDWVSGVVPSSTADAVINNSNAVTVNGTAVAHSLILNSSELVVSGSLSLGTSLTLNSGSEQSELALDGGSLSAQSIILNNGVLAGYGTISGSVNGSGELIEATGGTLKVEASLAGYSGFFYIGSSATLELCNGTSSAVDFGSLATLKLDAPTAFTGDIQNIVLGDTIDLAGITASSATYSGSTLTINETNGQQLTYSVSGSVAGDILTVASDNNGGTLVYWVQPPDSWITGTSGDWSTGPDWVSGVVPSSTADAVINNSNAVTVNGTAVAHSLILNSSELVVSGSLSLGTSLTLNSGSEQSELALDGGSLSAQSIILNNGVLAGYGTISGSVNGSGELIEATGGTLKVEASLAGYSGFFYIGSSATLELCNGTSSAVDFGSLATLKLDAPTAFTGDIQNIVLGDTIDLAGITASSATYSGSTLTINETNGQQLTYSVSGSVAGDILTVASDNNGGMDIYWGQHPAPTVAVSVSSSDVNLAANTATVTFAFSVAATDFSILGSTNATGGTLSNLQTKDGGNTYTATFTAASGTDISNASVSVAAGSYHDSAGFAGTAGSTTAFTVDTVTPTVAVSINNTDVNVANGRGTVTFTFSEAPTAFAPADTSAVGGTLSNLHQTDATHYTATFTGAPNTDISTASVSVTASSWQEGNGNPGAGGSTSSFTVDTVTPTVTSIVASPASGDKNTGTIITLTLTISEIVTVTGTPALTLNDGGTAIYQSGSDSNKLIFTYTVANAQNASALAVTGNNLNGTTVAIADTDGNAANLSGADVTFSGLAIGATVTSITANPPTGDLGPGKTVTFSVTMSEAVKLAGVTAPTTPFLTLNDGGTATYKSGSGTNILTFTYTVGALGSGQNASTLGVTGFNPNGATVYDSNVTADTANLSGVTSFTGGPQIDTIAPTVSSVAASSAGITNGNGDLDAGKTVTLTVSFSENVTVTGAPTLNLNDGAKATYTSGSGKSALTFTYVVAAGQNTADLAVNALALNGGTIKDAAGNNAVLTGAVTNPAGILKIDTTAPTISSVIASGTGITNGNGDLDAGNTVELTVNFSENVTVTGTPVLKLNDGGAASYTGGSGTSALTFAYLVAAGDNTPDLTVTGLVLNGGATITDAAGNSAVLSGAVKNPAGTLKIDSTAPAVTSVVASPSSGEVTTGHAVRITLNTSEAVTLSGAPLLLLNDGGTASYDVAQSTSKAMAFDYTVASGQVTTDLRVSGIQLPSTSSIEDLAGNNANLAGAGADLRLRINTNATGPAGASGGNFTVSGSTDLELFGASSANVSFAAGDTGTLNLHNSQSFTGTVAGLAVGNYLDLTDIAYVTSNKPDYTPNSGNTGGTLSVTDGTHTANIALLGNYLASSFVPSSDGHGGTNVVDPPATGQVALLAQHA